MFLLIVYIISRDQQRSLGGCATLTWIEGPAMMWEWICEDGPYVAIKPDKQGFYRATLYTGFQADSTSPTSHPQSKQAYKWKGTGWIDLNSLGCLSQESLFDFPLSLPPEIHNRRATHVRTTLLILVVKMGRCFQLGILPPVLRANTTIKERMS